MTPNSITGLIAAYAGGLAEVVAAGARAPITASGSFSIPVSLNPSTQTLKLSPPPNSPYQPLSLSVTIGPGATDVSAAISGALSIVGTFIGVPGNSTLGTNAAGYAVPGTGGGGGGNTFGPADYGVTTPDTFTFPATGDFVVSVAGINLSASADINLSSTGDTNIAATGSLDIQASGNGAMLISTNNGNLAITSGADGDAMDITANAIDGSISISANANISIDAGGTLEFSGSPIQHDGQSIMAAGNGTALRVQLGTAQSANLATFETHGGAAVVSGVDKLARFMMAVTSGAPGDTPADGTAPCMVDITAAKLYVFCVGGWKSVLLV